MGGSWGLGVGGCGRLGGHGLMGWGGVDQRKLTKKLKSPSNLHEKSFINLSDLEKKLEENSL